jgi:hypothetical protein
MKIMTLGMKIALTLNNLFVSHLKALPHNKLLLKCNHYYFHGTHLHGSSVFTMIFTVIKTIHKMKGTIFQFVIQLGARNMLPPSSGWKNKQSTKSSKSRQQARLASFLLDLHFNLEQGGGGICFSKMSGFR